MGYRQSDSPIVPMKVGNATGGKRREGRSSRLCYAKPYQRGNIVCTHRQEKNNGNEIGENITTIKRKPRHGVYINWTPHQQGTARRGQNH